MQDYKITLPENRLPDEPEYNFDNGREDIVTSEISGEETLAMMEKNKLMVFLDVRPPRQRALLSLGGLHIPLNELVSRFEEIAPNQIVVCYCSQGSRSQGAVRYLKGRGLKEVYRLTGGIDALSSDVVSTFIRKQELPRSGS